MSSVSTEKPAQLTPKQKIPKNLNLAQLSEIVSAQDNIIRNVVASADEKDEVIRKMEACVYHLEIEQIDKFWYQP